MPKYKSVQVTEETHKRIRLMAAIRNCSQMDIVTDAVNEKDARESLTRLVDPGEPYVVKEADRE